MQAIKTWDKTVINIKEEKRSIGVLLEQDSVREYTGLHKGNGFGIGFDAGACQTLGRLCPDR